MIGPKPEPKYRWARTQIDANDPPTDLDWMGYDGPAQIGRIRKEVNGPTKGKWQWAGWYPHSHKGSPPTPNSGYVETARAAALEVEKFWELCQRVMTRK